MPAPLDRVGRVASRAVDLLYRALLHLYPPRFRRRHGAQMRADFREMREHGAPLVVGFVDLARTVPREWSRALAPRRSPASTRVGPGPLDRAGDLLGETRRAVRSLARQPGFTGVAIASLGVGIGASTAVYSWTEGLVLHPLPAVRDLSRLVSVEIRDPTRSEDEPGASYPDLLDLRAALAPSGDLAGFGYGQFRVGDTEEETERVWGVFVTEAYFPTLGVEPLLGTLLGPAAPGPPASWAVISESVWTRRFGRDPDVVGRRIRIGDRELRVLGVAPPDFAGTTVGLRLDLWLPVAAAPDLRGDADLLTDRDARWLRLFARVQPTATRAAFALEVARVWSELGARPGRRRPLEIGVTALDIGVAARLEPLLVILLGLTGFVLLAVCTNVANLALMRGARREHEFAVLMTLGAGGGRIAGRVLLEASLLALGGVALGFAVAVFGARLLPAALPPSPLPLDLEAPMNLRVFLFSAAVGAGTVLAFGGAPALRATRTAPVVALRRAAAGRRGPSVRQSALVVIQLALSLGTLVAAGFFFDRLSQLADVDPGFRDPEDVVLLPIDLPGAEAERAWREGALPDFLRNVRGLPGVRAATIASFVPLGFGGYASVEVAMPEDPGPGSATPDRYLVNRVGDGYFDLMGTAIRRGRVIDERDGPGDVPAVVVNETMARRGWPEDDPLGRGLTVEGREAVVVGVAADGKYRYDALDEAPPPFVYLAWAQWPTESVFLHLRIRGSSAPVVRAVASRFDDRFPGGRLEAPMGLDDYMGVALVPVRLGASVLGGLGVLAVLLAALGLYAVMALHVVHRRREVGVRIAVGADRRSILGMFMGEGARTVVVGLAVGLPFAAAIQRVFQVLIASFDPDELSVYPLATGLLTVVALSAVGIAARRASGIEPAEALKTE